MKTAKATLPLLIVDPNPAALATYLPRLRNRFRVLTATNSGEALAHWHANPDMKMAVVELQLPDTSGTSSTDEGFRLLEVLLARHGVGVMVYSDADSFDHCERAIRLGVRDFLTRETSPKVLLAHARQIAAWVVAGEFPHDARFLTPYEVRRNDDYNWCLASPEVRAQYAGQVVTVFDKHVWGHGANHDVAFRAAEKLLAARRQDGSPPTLDDLIFVVVPARFEEAVAPSF